MGKEKMENHLKQIVLNIQYEYEAGRLSSLSLLQTVIQKLPIPLLEENTQLFFLPLTLSLVNDESNLCRESAANCISFLLKRLSMESLQSLYEYVLRWSKGNERQLLRTSAQLFGLFLDTRLDYIRRTDIAGDLSDIIFQCLLNEIDSIENASISLGKEWELCYFYLLCVEKINIQIPNLIMKQEKIWLLLIKYLVHPHPWVQRTASRIIYSYLSQFDSSTLMQKSGEKKHVIFLSSNPGSLFDLARNFCHQLGTDENKQMAETSILAIKSLAWIIRAMDSHSQLCFKEENEDIYDNGFDEIESEDRNMLVSTHRKPVTWLVTRLSNIAKLQGDKRREAIFKCFAALTTSCETSTMEPYLELMLEPLNRVIAENSNKSNLAENSLPLLDLSKELLQMLEDAFGTDAFLKAFTVVKDKAREKRERRKKELITEAVNDPKAAITRKIHKQEKEKRRKKRRVNERKSLRGMFHKKSRLDH